MKKREKHKRAIVFSLDEHSHPVCDIGGGDHKSSPAERLADAIMNAIEDYCGKKKTKEKTAGSRVWESYSTAYHARHGVEPVRNAKTNRILKQLTERIPENDAPMVAEFYVKHPLAFYAQRMHPVEILLRDAESLYVQWKKGKPNIVSKADQSNSNIVELWKKTEME